MQLKLSIIGNVAAQSIQYEAFLVALFTLQIGNRSKHTCTLPLYVVVG